MEALSYLVIKLERDTSGLVFPFYIRLLPDKLKPGFKKSYLFKKLPVRKKQLVNMDEEGIEVVLPFTREDLKKYSPEEISSMLSRIIMQEGAQNTVVESVLEPYLDQALIIDGKLAACLLVPDILRWVRKKHGISMKEMQLIIVDSGRIDTPFVLKQVDEDLNYLTIVTDRPDYFADYVAEQYEINGLLIFLAETTGPIPPGNILLDLSAAPESAKDLKAYPYGIPVIDLTGSKKKAKDISAKRKDLRCYNRFGLTCNGETIDSRILQAVICGGSTWLEQGELKHAAKELQKYNIQVQRVYTEV